jgi:hypothetical protein
MGPLSFVSNLREYNLPYSFQIDFLFDLLNKKNLMKIFKINRFIKNIIFYYLLEKG